MNSRARPPGRLLLGLAALAFAGSALAISNGQTTATASANGTSNTDCCGTTTSATTDAGIAVASSSAAIGSLSGSAHTVGCTPFPLFEQPCNGASDYGEFADLLTFNTGLAPGTPLQVEFDFDVDAIANGVGTLGLQARFVYGNQSVEVDSNSFGIVTGYSSAQLGGHRAVVINTCSGCALPIDTWMSFNVGNRYCETATGAGSGFCTASLANDLILTASATLSAHYLTAGATGSVTGVTGHDYAAVSLPDADGDYVPDTLDNCIDVANPTQLDADGDGYGNACDADLNNSGTVTAADFAIMRSVLGQLATASATAAAADLNGSGTVTAADFAILRAYLGKPPGPSALHPNCPPTCP